MAGRYKHFYAPMTTIINPSKIGRVTKDILRLRDCSRTRVKSPLVFTRFYATQTWIVNVTIQTNFRRIGVIRAKTICTKGLIFGKEGLLILFFLSMPSNPLISQIWIFVCYNSLLQPPTLLLSLLFASLCRWETGERQKESAWGSMGGGKKFKENASAAFSRFFLFPTWKNGWRSSKNVCVEG